MARRKQNKASGTAANKGIRRAPDGGMDLSRSWISSGHLDPSTLPKPSLPKWNGWKHLEND